MFLGLKTKLFSQVGLFMLCATTMSMVTVKQALADSQIRITAGDTVLTATLYDNATNRDFISLMPMTLRMKDYAGTEKVSDLPKKLSTEGAPSGSMVDVASFSAPVS
ncbi:hypothetical protein DI392_14925 [Vibrio albus]|uniref:Cyclophilin-like domain-containing protein n=1 Tax=Vibrio albus TaxID=2200953 RepID=A0A2U3B6D9_9VIBR|nr:cyclophilin-like fold protein [Vibrio albus]PWI32363.1 hypothetical protein DI392_14925 [Vibrio albus]